MPLLPPLYVYVLIILPYPPIIEESQESTIHPQQAPKIDVLREPTVIPSLTWPPHIREEHDDIIEFDWALPSGLLWFI